MKKFKQALSKKKDKDTASISSKLSECPESGYTVNKDLPKLHKAVWAGELQTVRTLLGSSKAQVDGLDSEGRTALHLACSRGHAEICKDLLAHNAKANLEDKSKKTPLLKAIECQHVDCVKQLVSKVNLNMVDQSGENALHHAVKTGNGEMVRILANSGAKLDLKNRNSLNPLLLAVTLNHEDVAKALLDQGANVDAATSKRRTALMIACEKNSVSTVKLLLEHKANVRAEDEQGQTAEKIASANGNAECVKLVSQAREAQAAAETPGEREYEEIARVKSIVSAGNKAQIASSDANNTQKDVEDEDEEDDDEEDDTKPSSSTAIKKPVAQSTSEESSSNTPVKTATNNYSTVNKFGVKIQHSESESETESDPKKGTKPTMNVKRDSSDEEDSEMDSLDSASLSKSPVKLTNGKSKPLQQLTEARREDADDVSSITEVQQASISETEVIPVDKPSAVAVSKPSKVNTFTIDDSDSDSEDQSAEQQTNKTKTLVVGVDDKVVRPESIPNVNKSLPAATNAGKDSVTPIAKTRTSVEQMAVVGAEITNPLAQQVAALQEKLNAQDKQLDNETQQKRELSAEVESLRRTNAETLKQLESAKHAKLKLESEQTDRETALRKTQLALQEESEKLRNAEVEVGKLKKLAEEKQTQTGREKAEKEQAEAALRKLKHELDESKGKVTLGESENEKLKQKIGQLADENGRLQTALRDAETRVQTMAAQNADDAASDADESSRHRRARDGTTGSITSVENFALLTQIEELKSRHRTEEAKMQAEKEALEEKIQQLDKEVDVLKAALNEASLQHQLQLQKANDLLRAEQDRRLKTEQELAAARLAVTVAEGERDRERAATPPPVAGPSLAMNGMQSDHEARLRELEAILVRERRDREELETKLTTEHEELQRVDGFVQQLFGTLKKHYKPDPVLQPLIDEINRVVDVYNGEALSHRESILIPPPQSGDQASFRQSLEDVTMRQTGKLNSSKPTLRSTTRSSEVGEEVVVRQTARQRATYATPTGTQRTANANANANAITNQQDTLESNGVGASAVTVNGTGKLVNPMRSSISSFNDRQRTQLTDQNQRQNAELKIQELINAVDKIQTDLVNSAKAMDEARKRPRRRRRQARSMTGDYRSASLPGGPNGILHNSAARSHSHSRGMNHLASTSEEEEEDEDDDVSTVSATDDDMVNVVNTQSIALQNIRQQLNIALESIRKEPQNAANVVNSVNGAVMPALASISQQLTAQPLTVQERAKRRGERRKIVNQINDMLREQTAQLAGRIEQLRGEAEKKFVDRYELEELNRSIELAQSRIQTAEEVEKVNHYLEQQLRAQQELERKRIQYTIAADQKHSEAKRELDSEMRKLREALTNAASQKAELESENRSLSNLYRGAAQSRENIMKNFRSSLQQPASMVPVRGTYSSRPVSAAPIRPSVSLSTPESDVFAARLSQELKRSINMHVEARTANGNGMYTPSVRSTVSDSYRPSSTSPDIHAYRDYIQRKYLF